MSHEVSRFSCEQNDIALNSQNVGRTGKEHNMEQFTKPTEVNLLEAVFGVGVMSLMPKYEDIPDDFKKQNNLFIRWQQEWFFRGLKVLPRAKEGIDQKTAIKHLAAIQESFEPQHEHKEAAVAYLASLWLEIPATGLPATKKDAAVSS